MLKKYFLIYQKALSDNLVINFQGDTYKVIKDFLITL